MSIRKAFPLLPELAHRPDVAVILKRERDDYYQWDGDGPDPCEDGFDPYDVMVKVVTIRNGRLFEGKDTLGGCYFKPDEPFDEIHGYLPQMLEAALEELDQQLIELTGEPSPDLEQAKRELDAIGPISDPRD